MHGKTEKIRLVFYMNCLGRGGAHQTSLAWFDLLRENPGFELRIFCHAEGWFTGQLRKRGLPFEILPMPAALGAIKHGTWNKRLATLGRVLSMAGGLARAWWRVAFLRADVVVLTGGRDFVMFFPLVLRRRRHTVTVPQTTDWGRIPTCKTMCRLAAHTYAISQSVADSITAMGIAPSKVGVHPLIYTADFNGRLPPKSEIRRKLGLPEHAPVLGMTGVIRPQKGQRDAVLVLAEAVKRLPEAKLVIVGAAPADVPAAAAYDRELRELVAEKKLRDHVVFLGWRDDVPEVMHAFDFLLVPSHDNEGVPRVILEGLEAALPIAATDIPQFREILAQHGTGILHPVDRHARWAADLAALFNDRAAYVRASRHARAVWEREYSFNGVRPRIEKAFRDPAQAR